MEEYRIESHYEVMPNDLNPAGIIFGGVISAEVDKLAGILAKKFFKVENVLTVSSYYTFLNPVYLGETLRLVAELKEVGNKSIGIKVEVFSLNSKSESRKISDCFLVFVAKDKEGKLIEIKNPKLKEKYKENLKSLLKEVSKKLES